MSLLERLERMREHLREIHRLADTGSEDTRAKIRRIAREALGEEHLLRDHTP